MAETRTPPVSASTPAPVATGAGDSQQFLTFSLTAETFAVGILNIKEIIEYGGVTPVPMMPACIRGVINLRGAVLPVVDLAARFGRARTEAGRRSCIVIVELTQEFDGQAQRQDVGIMVDGVREVLEIPARDVEPTPGFGASIRTDFIAGMGRVGEEFVIILNVARVLSLEELAQLAAGRNGTALPPP